VTLAELHQQFASGVNSGSVDALLDLYEDGATFITATGTPVMGKAAIKEVLSAFLALKPQFRIEASSAYEGGGDLALLEARWAWEGNSPEGWPMRLTGTSREVARRGADGKWRYAIDDPGTS
jgi:uncharacterized protein (TIGR02246 family)